MAQTLSPLLITLRMAILAKNRLSGIVMLGWLALTKQAAAARLWNGAGRRMMNAAPCVATPKAAFIFAAETLRTPEH
jgi:hypothetical protein